MPIGMTLDDLHDDDDFNLDPVDPTDENLDGDGNPIDPTNDSNEDPNDDPADSKAVDEPTDDAPGIEQFLAQYGISGGIISFAGEEGGEPVNKHFNELTSEEQFTVLTELANSGLPSMEAKYGLDREEIGLLNFVRESGKSVEEALNDLAQERVQQILTLRDSFDTDYKNMSADAITSKWLKDNNPEATEEELAEELARSKESRFFERNAETIRNNYIAHQADEIRKEENAHQAEQEELIENDRAVIAQAAAEIEHVAGFVIDDNSKNEILSKILEVNQHGDSLFMEEVFSDPEKLFRAAWLFYNTDTYLDQLDQKHKKDLANEYKKGRDHAINGFSSDPVSGVDANNTRTTTNGKPDPVRREPGGMTLDDLHNDDD